MKRHTTSQPSFTKRQASVAGLCAVLAATAIFAIPKKARAGVFPKITQLALRLEMDVFGRLSGILGSAGWETQPGTRRLHGRTAARASSGETETRSMQLTQAMELDSPDSFAASYGADSHSLPYLPAGNDTSSITHGPGGNRDAAGRTAATYAGAGASGSGLQARARGAGGSGSGAPFSSATRSAAQKPDLELNKSNRDPRFAAEADGRTTANQESASISSGTNGFGIANLIYQPAEFQSGSEGLAGTHFGAQRNNPVLPDESLSTPDEEWSNVSRSVSIEAGASVWASPDVASLLQGPARGGSSDLTSGVIPDLPSVTGSDAALGSAETNDPITRSLNDVIPDPGAQTTSKDDNESDQNPSLAEPGGDDRNRPHPIPGSLDAKDQRASDDPIATSEPSSIVFLGTMLILLTLVYKRTQKGKRQPVTAVDTGSGAALS
ncbi:MAG TPA: hypothetical protein VJN43_08745 [Bryobacteraceae bacterium]|nr:hypothetical protein [Bryobacteraceae bacterium]